MFFNITFNDRYTISSNNITVECNIINNDDEVIIGTITKLHDISSKDNESVKEIIQNEYMNALIELIDSIERGLIKSNSYIELCIKTYNYILIYNDYTNINPFNSKASFVFNLFINSILRT